MKTYLPFHRLFKSRAGQPGRKTILSFMLIVFLWTNLSAQNSANIIIQPASTTTTVGQSFTVTVRVDFTTPPGSSSVDAVEVHLAFDKTKDTITAITKSAIGVLPTEAIPLQSIHTINTNGQVNYAAATSSGFPNADFDFLTITFNVIGGGGTITPLSFLTSFPNKTDAQRLGSSILGSVANGSVNIQNCTAPTATIASSSSSS
ncbi:MAG: cohesin domain-containing protein, partial [Bacteroidota bacterium]|nr:cohesin domain-containing protein [Bacteroidota bacterium]